jgi:RNA polymerase sigma factor (TIGR02999 family)
MIGSGNITQLLRQAAEGSVQADDALFDAVYRELRSIAKSQRRRWSGNDTLNTTALVSEAYLRLADSEFASYSDRAHFFATASRAMRQILINYAERVSTAKRGGGALRVTLTNLPLQNDDAIDELLHLEALLQELEASHARQCRVFECRVFGGMTNEETAAALLVSVATVKRDWAIASAWLYSRIMDPEDRRSQETRE